MSWIGVIGERTAGILGIMVGLLVVTATLIFSLSLAILTMKLMLMVITVVKVMLLSRTLGRVTRRIPRPIGFIRMKICWPVPTGGFTVPCSPLQGPLLGGWFPTTALHMVLPIPTALVMATLMRYYSGRSNICIPPSLFFRMIAAAGVPLFS